RFDSRVKYFQQLLSYMCPPVVAVFLCGLFWKRATATGAFVSLVSGFVIACGLLFGIRYTPMAKWNFLYIAPLILAISLGIIFVVSLFTTPSEEIKIRTYVWNVQVFREETRNLAGVPWFRNYRTLAALLLAGAAGFILIWH